MECPHLDSYVNVSVCRVKVGCWGILESNLSGNFKEEHVFACDVCNLEQNKTYGVQGGIQMRNKTVWSVKMNSLMLVYPWLAEWKI